MTEQLICYDCGKEVAMYNARREIIEDNEEKYIDVRVCKDCKVKEKIEQLEYDYSFGEHTIIINNVKYHFKLRNARVIVIKYNNDNNTFQVRIVFDSYNWYTVEYDFDLNPISVQ
jgi:glutaredoxin-related protein